MNERISPPNYKELIGIRTIFKIPNAFSNEKIQTTQAQNGHNIREINDVNMVSNG